MKWMSISFLASAILILSACKKEESTYKLSGCVLDGRSGNPVSGATASVEKQVVSGGTFGATYSQAASTNSDGAGVFRLEWPRENFAALRLKAAKANYISSDKDLLVSEFEGGQLVEENITIFPESFITVKLINGGEAYAEDVCNFSFTNAEFDCVCCSNGFKVFEGASIDTQYTCKLYGDTWLKYQKQIFSLESDTIVNDSIWCPAFTTTELTIQY